MRGHVDEYAIDIFGKFNNVEIISIVDPDGSFWFQQGIIAQALGIEPSALTHIRQNHPEEFTENVDYKGVTFNGRRHLVYSEEGFLTICDMSSSEAAYRLRKWMRQQFRVKHSGSDIVVEAKAKSLPREDLSDLGQDLVLMQHIIDGMADDRRRLRIVENEQKRLAAESEELKGKVTEHATKIAAWEDGAKVKPGEMTALQLATHCRWLSQSGGAHNVAVVLAAVNAGFIEKGLMQGRREQGPGGLTVEVQVFTPDGVALFLSQIDSKYSSGESFTLVPNSVARKRYYKQQRHVYKA